MLRVLEDLFGGAVLDHVAAVHHEDVLAHLGDDAEVVRDHDDGGVQPLLQVAHEVEDLRLDRDVERGRRLVGDEQFRIARERHGDHDALAHAAGELVRIVVDAVARRRGCGRA